ncbi:PRANC domain protein [Orientia chuto str. Dubai]|uniref:PRANC domain protein n=1 Tax=Orientia chuto str. Dubai TaxID=1359168 RepID=A0A0F3MK85_9RICK|nr:PRANC domain-containing protein [Candidatus Orientia mediorientalis]KJV56183.1 PRANC domain protein [Orientia chuto str. Dubai]
MQESQELKNIYICNVKIIDLLLQKNWLDSTFRLQEGIVLKKNNDMDYAIIKINDLINKFQIYIVPMREKIEIARYRGEKLCLLLEILLQNNKFNRKIVFEEQSLFTTLPAEIYRNILEYCSNDDLENLYFACTNQYCKKQVIGES